MAVKSPPIAELRHTVQRVIAEDTYGTRLFKMIGIGWAVSEEK
jgi:hypothetical protein